MAYHSLWNKFSYIDKVVTPECQFTVTPGLCVSGQLRRGHSLSQAHSSPNNQFLNVTLTLFDTVPFPINVQDIRLTEWGGGEK